MILFLILLLGISSTSLGMHTDKDSRALCAYLELDFLDAVHENRDWSIVYSLDHGVDINCIVTDEQVKQCKARDLSHLAGRSALCIAVQNGNIRLARTLLKKGADASGVVKQGTLQNSEVCHPLHIAVTAALSGSGNVNTSEEVDKFVTSKLAMIELLLAYGADYAKATLVDNNTLFHRCAYLITEGKDQACRQARYTMAGYIVRKIFALQLPNKSFCTESIEYNVLRKIALTRIVDAFRVQNMYGLQAWELLSSSSFDPIIFHPEIGTNEKVLALLMQHLALDDTL